MDRLPPYKPSPHLSHTHTHTLQPPPQRSPTSVTVLPSPRPALPPPQMLDYPTAGPSRAPSYTLPPLHSIASPHGHNALPYSSSFNPNHYSGGGRAPTYDGHFQGGQGSRHPSPPSEKEREPGTPGSAGGTKKRRRPTKTEPSAPNLAASSVNGVGGGAAMSATSGAGADSAAIRQTQRVPLSCKECSRRKIKCDKMVPCRPCIERGEDATCRREAVIVKGKVVTNDPPRPGSTIEALAQENVEIRRRVDRLERLIGRHTPQSPRVDEALDFKEDRLTGVMEEVALGIGENVRWKGVSLLTHPESAAGRKDQWYHSVPLEACLSTIPNRVKSDALVSFFTAELYWLDGAVHVPTFAQQHAAFWTKSDRGQVDDDNWLALYFAVLSLAGYFMESDAAQMHGFQTNELARLAKVWFDCSIAILMRNNLMGAPAFVALQAIHTLRYPFHLSGNTAIHSNFAQLAMRTAMSMNLHLLGSSRGESKEERLAREMGRRVWWSSVEPDWYFLPYLRYSCISPHQFTTALPDLDDELEPLSTCADPLHFRLAMYRSSRVLYRLFGNLAPSEDPRYEAVLAASEDLDVIIGRLPDEFQLAAERDGPGASPTTACVRRFLQMTLAHRAYLIHRAYYIKSFRDETYAPSHTACITAATDIIALAEQGLPQPFYRLWNTTVWLVAAGIVLALDLLQAAEAKRDIPDATARRATLGNLVELLYNSGDVNVGIASRGAALIVHLGRAEQEIIAGSRQGAKVSRDDILDLIRRSELAPNPQPLPKRGGLGDLVSGGLNSGTTAANKPFTPPASTHRSGSLQSQSLPGDSPAVYQHYMPGGGDGSGSLQVPGPGPGAGAGGAWANGMLDLGMGMGISPGLPAVGAHGAVPALGIGPPFGGPEMNGGFPGDPSSMAPPAMVFGNYAQAGQEDWMLPDGGGILGFIDELFPPGR